MTHKRVKFHMKLVNSFIKVRTSPTRVYVTFKVGEKKTHIEHVVPISLRKH